MLQSASNFSAVGFVQVDPYFLRWETGGSISGNDAVNVLRVAGQATGTASSVYSIAFRETTLFCPRFNNTGTQVSVLIVQSAHYGANSCSFNAHFYNEAGALVGTQPGTLDVDGKVIVISMPTVSGAANERGAARITHTCGYGNVKSKLVALEPANGFSFDTPCTTRE